MSLSDLQCKIMSDDMRNELTGMSYCVSRRYHVHSFVQSVDDRMPLSRVASISSPVGIYLVFHHAGLTYDYEGNGVSLMFLFEILLTRFSSDVSLLIAEDMTSKHIRNTLHRCRCRYANAGLRREHSPPPPGRPYSPPPPPGGDGPVPPPRARTPIPL